MSRKPYDPCAIAIERYKNLARWRNLWTILLFIFGTTVIIFLCAAILLFVNESWLPGAISTVGTIANGAGVAWVVTRRNEAVKEETHAYEDVKRVCGGPAPSGVEAADRAATEDVEKELADFTNRLKLFGPWR
jgi:hypothetical protein